MRIRQLRNETRNSYMGLPQTLGGRFSQPPRFINDIVGFAGAVRKVVIVTWQVSSIL